MSHDARITSEVLPRERWVWLVVLRKNLVENFWPLNEFGSFRSLVVHVCWHMNRAVRRVNFQIEEMRISIEIHVRVVAQIFLGIRRVLLIREVSSVRLKVNQWSWPEVDVDENTYLWKLARIVREIGQQHVITMKLFGELFRFVDDAFHCIHFPI